MSRFPRLVALVAALLAWPSIGARAAPAAASPNLVVVVSVDQMRADYIDQFRGQWSHGLKTLLGRGAVFRNARYPYLNTITCAGHATIGTGAFPHRHGMILNAWWDPVPAQAGGMHRGSGRAGHLLRATPGITRAQRPQHPGPDPCRDPPEVAEAPARAVSFAGKARSAIGLVGKGGDLVLWYEGDGTWATSRAFASARTPLVERVLGQLATEKLIARPWDRVLPAAATGYADDAPGERLVVPWWTNRFPHPLVPPDGAPPAATPLPPLAAWDRSPMPDEVLLELATAALEEMALGQGMGTDFLALGFSSLDTVGHAFGPRSHEVQDVLVRLDRLLGQLLARLDRRWGRAVTCWR
jgi:hypothetical protein